MKYACIESTVEFVAGNYEIRAWFDESQVQVNYSNVDFKIFAKNNAWRGMAELAELLAAKPKVNAVHIKDLTQDKDGICIYTIW